MNDDQIRALVRKRIEEKGFNLSELSKRLGRNHAYIQQYLERGTPRVLPENIRDQMEAILGFDAGTLKPKINPEGDPSRRDVGSLRVATLPPSSEMPRDVPVLGIAVGGENADFRFNGEVTDYVRRPPSIMSARNVFSVFVEGDSMSPRYEPGELIYINPDRPANVGDDVVIEMLPTEDGQSGACYLKRLEKRAGTKLICRQFNPARDDLAYDTAAIKRIYRVIPASELLGT
jgi:phage repressor protein C with HTH and peptisase S24 domain